METLDKAVAFIEVVHAAQKNVGGIWLADHPFVRAVRGGTARREEIEGWVKQIHCATSYYREILESQNVQALPGP